MRLTTPTPALKTIITSSTSTKTSTKNTTMIKSPHPWLHTLKATTLQHLAQKTGIKSSGPKPVLIRRLEGELSRCEYLQHGSGSESEGSTNKNKKSRELRILSIDMGIRNLAFACLIVPPSPQTHHSDSSSSSSSSLLLSESRDQDPRRKIILEAWRRLSIPRIREELNLNLSPSTSMPGLKSQPWMRLITSDEEITNTKTDTNTGTDKDSTATTVTAKAATKEDFSPAIYAHYAYTLITTLLDLYRPTHILIERQRFRSGGGSAVQEWTIRVGVFEGMLYAVLRTLGGGFFSGAEKGGSVGGGGGIGEVEVWGMEPGRVSRFWGEGEGEGEEGHLDADQGGDGVEGKGKGKGKGKKRKSVRDVKKMKIGLVGGWLGKTGEETGRGMGRVVVGEDVEVRKWVDAFLGKYEGKRRKKKGDQEGDDHVEIGKLDDLADCLVQGVTWLEWQRMRQKVVLAEGRIE